MIYKQRLLTELHITLFVPLQERQLEAEDKQVRH